MSDFARLRLGVLGKLVAMIVTAGVLVAALLFPWIGGTGLVARNSASLLDALPVELTDETPNGNTTVLAADGSVITQFYVNNRTPVTPDEISPIMKQAIVDIEDSRFYEHNGLDVQGTLRALAKNVAAGSVQEGGSTLTQQLVKQTLLQTADTAEERDAAIEQDGAEGVGRKLREARLALALEQTYSKDEILTRYLNIAYFGHGAYGIQAAAQTYFSVDAADLTLPQASVLAGLVQSPSQDDPLVDPAASQTRRNQVLNRMHDLGHISDQELAEVSAGPVQTAAGARPPNGCAYAAIGGFFCAYLEQYLTNTLGLTQTQIDNGGWTIRTTLDPAMQAAGDQGVLNTLPMGADLAGMYTAVEPGTGHLLAMSVNRRFGCDRTADSACESVVLNAAASQGAGSTYKVFTAAAALAQGYSEYYTLTTGDPYTSRVFKKNGGTTGAPYTVGNAGRYAATMDMRDALIQSSNTYFVALQDALGSVEGPVRMAQAMGLRSLDPIADQIIAEKRGSFTLGPDATSPLDLASAYSTLAANGTRCTPTPVLEILGRDGEPLTGPDGEPVIKDDNCTEEAIPPGVATTLNQILLGDVQSPQGTGTRAAIPGHDIAGKTGTSQSNFSAAFVGYTPEIAASVMVLNPKGNQNVGGFGGNKPATIWHDAMEPILSGRPKADFPPADPVVQNGNTRPVPRCGSVSSCTSALQADGLRAVTTNVDSSEPRGTVVGTSPPAGARAVQDQVVTIRVSNGSGFSPPAPRTQSPPSPSAPPADQPPPSEPAAPPADSPPPDTNGDGQPG
ncbi:MAG TPA: penicillin-binding protein [Modestobacter sp.]|nr:penicillin-binding protein [Modestobacter sp.]